MITRGYSQLYMRNSLTTWSQLVVFGFTPVTFAMWPLFVTLTVLLTTTNCQDVTQSVATDTATANTTEGPKPSFCKLS